METCHWPAMANFVADQISMASDKISVRFLRKRLINYPQIFRKKLRSKERQFYKKSRKRTFLTFGIVVEKNKKMVNTEVEPQFANNWETDFHKKEKFFKYPENSDSKWHISWGSLTGNPSSPLTRALDFTSSCPSILSEQNVIESCSKTLFSTDQDWHCGTNSSVPKLIRYHKKLQRRTVGNKYRKRTKNT